MKDPSAENPADWRTINLNIQETQPSRRFGTRGNSGKLISRSERTFLQTNQNISLVEIHPVPGVDFRVLLIASAYPQSLPVMVQVPHQLHTYPPCDTLGPSYRTQQQDASIVGIIPNWSSTCDVNSPQTF